MNIVDLNNEKYTGETLYDVEDFLHTVEKYWKDAHAYLLSSEPLFFRWVKGVRWCIYELHGFAMVEQDESGYCLGDSSGVYPMSEHHITALLPGDVEKCHELAG